MFKMVKDQGKIQCIEIIRVAKINPIIFKYSFKNYEDVKTQNKWCCNNEM